MADQKLTELTEDTNPTSDDLLYIVDGGLATSRKVTVGNLMKAILTTVGDLLVRTASGISRLPVGTNGQRLVANSASYAGFSWENEYFGITIHFGDGQNVIQTSEPKVQVRIPANCVLESWHVEEVNGYTGSIRFNTRRRTSLWGTFEDIDGSEPVQLSSQSRNINTTLSSWTTVWNKDDYILVEIDPAVTPSGVKRVVINFTLRKTV